jgi:uncharacterized protein
MLIDSHIHVGQYYNIYTSPQDLLQLLDAVGVGQFAVSSTSICEGNYDKVLSELQELSIIAHERMFPVLWIIPAMLKDGGLERFLSSGIQWRCLKIHPQLNPFYWQQNSADLEEVINLAKKLNVPILIHTGEKEGCEPLLFKEAISANPSVRFILAHARPLEQTIALMKSYQNVWADTAFVPTENVVDLCNEGFSDRILWGTDYPIPRYFYPEANMQLYYEGLLSALQKSVTQADYGKITSENFLRCYGVE